MSSLLNVYEVFVQDADFVQKDFTYPALGLAGETGELVEIVKKLQRPGAKLTDDIRQKALLEAGDVLWYLTRLSQNFGWSLEAVIAANMQKLQQRRKENGR